MKVINGAIGAALLVVVASGCGNGPAGTPVTASGGVPAGTPTTGNLFPAANAGSDLSVLEGATVVLDGSGSDSDGSVSGFQWRQDSGVAVALADASTRNPQFVAPPVTADSVLVFTLTVTDNRGGSGQDSVRVTVRDAGTVSGPVLSVADSSAAEGAGRLDFTVRLTPAAAGEVRVDVATQDQTATAGTDYTALASTLVFAAGETEKLVSVPVLQDALDEPAETLALRLSSPVGAALGSTLAVGTLVDDDLPVAADIGYGSGVIGALARFTARMDGGLAALAAGNFTGAGGVMSDAFNRLVVDTGGVLAGEEASVAALIGNVIANAQEAEAGRLLAQAAADSGAVIGLDTDPLTAVQRALSAERRAQAVVLNGSQLPGWSVPPAFGLPFPYPSGAAISGSFLPDFLQRNGGRDAHNGIMLYPLPGLPALLLGKPVDRIAAYRWDGNAFAEIPVQVDQKFPYFLANSNSSFSTYSGTDQELTYEWDRERWQNTSNPANPCIAQYAQGKRDPVSGLDDDDEVAFMLQDAGAPAPPGAMPSDPDLDTAELLQEVRLVDPLNPTFAGTVYLGLKRAGSRARFLDQQVYVRYVRDGNADQWIDRSFFTDDDPEKIGTSNTAYGANLAGPVCSDGTPATLRNSTDRFPRDGTTVFTDTYRWRATGRWMVREIQVARPGQTLSPPVPPADRRMPGADVVYSPDLIDRWKGRAFQQSPDSSISIVGFEDEQVNWEANAILIGDRVGPVRAMRATWGADSGTNVTKTETFYRDAVAYRYRLRVHPIPPDGLYTSWDYNRGAMLPAAGENVPAGRYYTLLRPQGVPVDGVNDEIGQIDGILPLGGQCLSLDAQGFVPPAPDGRCPAFFDVADPTFNLPLSFANWEQISGKGDHGSLVYTFELKGATSLTNPLVLPYFRDDACLDDGTGDDPVQRPFPGEAQTDARVRRGYVAEAGGDIGSPAAIEAGFAALRCDQKQGAHGAHGVHYLFTHDTDNAFLLGVPLTEVDAQQWQFMVPTAQPMNVGQRYYNLVTVPVLPLVTPRPALP